MWTEDAGQFAKEQRDKSRRMQQEKAEKHLAMMAAIEREKYLDKILHCPLCDVVRAEAYGLGHSNWKERLCSKCFSASSERLAHQRHSSPPPLDPSTTNLVLELTLQEKQARTEITFPVDPLLSSPTWAHEPFLPHRSRRLSSSPSPSKAQRATAANDDPHPPLSVESKDLLEGLDEMLSALKQGNTKEVLRLVIAHPHLEQSLDQALPQHQHATTTQASAGSQVPNASHSSSLKEPAAEMMPAIDKVRAELKQAEEDLVFAPTQRERSAALNLAFKLRKELAVLIDLERREKRAENIYKNKIRGPSGPVKTRSDAKDDSTFSPSEGIKTIVRDQNEKVRSSGCPGLAIAAESKARRTERALEERLHSNSKQTLVGYGIVATPSSAARIRKAANAYSALSRNSKPSPRPASSLVTSRDPRNQITHPDKPDPLLMMDAVTWRPVSPRLPPYHPPGYGQAGDYDGLDPMAELAKLRSMKVDDYKSQVRKEREWKRAVEEVTLELERTTDIK